MQRCRAHRRAARLDRAGGPLICDHVRGRTQCALPHDLGGAGRRPGRLRDRLVGRAPARLVALVTAGPGPFNPYADELVHQLRAVGVVLIIVGPWGEQRDAHAVSFHDQEHLRRMPLVLRRLAADIEADLAHLSTSEGRG